MFERFSEHARHVVVEAQDTARVLRHNYIGTEHLLLVLSEPEHSAVARLVLAQFGAFPGQVRLEVNRIVGKGDEVTTGQIPFTPRAKRVLGLALREALTLKSGEVQPEHIFLGLLREGEGIAAAILGEFGMTPMLAAERTVTALALSAPEGYATSFAETAAPPPPPRLARPRPARAPRRRSEPTPPPAALTPSILFAVAFALGLLLAWLGWG